MCENRWDCSIRNDNHHVWVKKWQLYLVLLCNQEEDTFAVKYGHQTLWYFSYFMLMYQLPRWWRAEWIGTVMWYYIYCLSLIVTSLALACTQVRVHARTHTHTHHSLYIRFSLMMNRLQCTVSTLEMVLSVGYMPITVWLITCQASSPPSPNPIHALPFNKQWQCNIYKFLIYMRQNSH